MIKPYRFKFWVAGLSLFLIASYSFATAIPVEIEHADGRFTLYRGGEPYFIKGGGGHTYMDVLAARGGNSIRTWDAVNAGSILDEAQKHGLTVTLGLWVGHEAHGFDYEDPAAISRQFEKFRKIVLAYKDHPALLMWGIGNEVNLNYRNIKVWDAVEQIAAMVHELDDNHPTMTVLAGMPKRDIRLVANKCPNIDVLGINAYAALVKVPYVVRDSPWDAPYVVTEWANNGYWEVGRTHWGASFEQTSNQKAAVYRERYENFIAADTERSLGSYVFYWGNSQELTPTWFGLFVESGEQTSTVDVMQYVWTGSWPQNRAPEISSFVLDGTDGRKPNAYLLPSSPYRARVSLDDLDDDNLELKWEIRQEVKRNSVRRLGPPIKLVGDFEAVTEGTEGTFYFNTPDQVGAYRLYVYAFDGHNHTATANIPFYVRDAIKAAGQPKPHLKASKPKKTSLQQI